MKPSFVAFSLVLVSLPLCAADPPQELVGPLAPELVPDESTYQPVRLEPAPAGTAEELPAPAAAGDRLFSGRLAWTSDKERHARLVLVEPVQGEAFLYADTDLDGKLAAGERYEFGDGKPFPATVLAFPWKNGSFPSFRVRVMRPSQVSGIRVEEGQRFLLAALSASLEGTVEIDGRKTLVRYTLSGGAGDIDPLQGEIGIDVDGDGSIDSSFGSPETDQAEGAPAVFRVGERYVSVQSIDPAAGRIVLRTHPASDFKRFDLSVGAQVPDFAFQDFDGKTRRLSAFRGKHVLLDFWASWCVPCVAQFPHLKELYETYRSHGFEILGMNRDESAEPARAMIGKERLPWTNATPESVREVALQGFRARQIPVNVLLDPEGRVVARGVPGMPGLRKDELTALLEERLPARPAAR